MASGELGDEADRAGAGDARRVRALLPGAAGSTRDEVDAVATSAIRDARTRQSSCTRARGRSGLPIRVLSREEEARYGYLAAVNSTTLDGRAACSTSAAARCSSSAWRDGRPRASSASWPLGTVRMSERFLPANGPAKRRQLEASCASTSEPSSPSSMAGCRARGAPGRLVGIGGTRAQPGRRGAARRRVCRPTACRGW